MIPLIEDSGNSQTYRQYRMVVVKGWDIIIHQVTELLLREARGDGCWRCLYSSVNLLNATELFKMVIVVNFICIL